MASGRPPLRPWACNLAAAALLAPLLAASAFFILVNGVFGGTVFSLLWRTAQMLEASPSWSAPALAAFATGALAALAFACVRVAWLFPSLLLVGGGFAGAYVLLFLRPGDAGNVWFQVPGLGGLFLAALQVRRATRA